MMIGVSGFRSCRKVYYIHRNGLAELVYVSGIGEHSKFPGSDDTILCFSLEAPRKAEVGSVGVGDKCMKMDVSGCE